jgi:hypothetical protein
LSSFLTLNFHRTNVAAPDRDRRFGAPKYAPGIVADIAIRFRTSGDSAPSRYARRRRQCRFVRHAAPSRTPALVVPRLAGSIGETLSLMQFF